MPTPEQITDVFDAARATLAEFEKCNATGVPTKELWESLVTLQFKMWAVDHPQPEPIPEF